ERCRIAVARFARARKFLQRRLHTGAADRDPAVGVFGDVREQLRSGRAADQHRRTILLRGLRPRPGRLEMYELAVETRLLVPPQRLHREDVLAGDLAPALHVDAVVFDLVSVPAEPD